MDCNLKTPYQLTEGSIGVFILLWQHFPRMCVPANRQRMGFRGGSNAHI